MAPAGETDRETDRCVSGIGILVVGSFTHMVRVFVDGVIKDGRSLRAADQRLLVFLWNNRRNTWRQEAARYFVFKQSMALLLWVEGIKEPAQKWMEEGMFGKVGRTGVAADQRNALSGHVRREGDRKEWVLCVQIH